MEIAKATQKQWARTPLWKRAELLHKVVTILKQHKDPIAECLVKFEGTAISKKARMIPLQMELGGKDACIVFEDADLDLVASNIVKGGYSYSGQRCTVVKVALVMESVADAVVEKVKANMTKLTVAPPEQDFDITPVVFESSANFIEGLLKDAKEKGATEGTAAKQLANAVESVGGGGAGAQADDHAGFDQLHGTVGGDALQLVLGQSGGRGRGDDRGVGVVVSGGARGSPC
ncbi:NADP-dependent glyceraldehyde-3-phosphate dehydrogenase [Canna indica]|uniref:NADP-dependent glyceraldehyde-3-phosphate dehydrogenase n=1 Tax=Canna indica TaxID=4628 RepID=A0AAQ3L1J7_9LILI|nr:NADP-dependent glyceraldehyde-3-phosphate dehydrogenase [Canna indica]